MIKKKIHYGIVLLFIFFSACGYEPLNKNFSYSKIEISKKTFSGDSKINRKIFNKLNLVENNQGFGYELKLNTNKKIDEVSKDKSGNVTTYKTSLSVSITLIKDQETLKSKTFSKSFNYNNLDNKFDLVKYQKDVENNLINSIVRDIRIFLN